MRRIGVHTSIAGGIHKGLETALALGCNTLQIFSHNPRGWASRDIPRKEIDAFIGIRKDHDISPVVIHTSYLINPASRQAGLRKKSIEMLVYELDLADRLGAEYVVLHPGSAAKDAPAAARERIIASLLEISRKGKWRAGLLLENTSGRQGDVTSGISDLGEIIKKVPRRLVPGICLDTCHAFAAGYNLRTKKGIAALADEITMVLGKEGVRLLHVNDSKKDLGSGRDRHEHIGRGRIGSSGLKKFLHHDTFSDLPVILETPKVSTADDRMNLRRVRRMMGSQ